MDLQGLPIVITGASSGIGRATAVACARAGMPVLACARRGPRLEALVKEIESAGGRAAAIECDVAVEADCDRAVTACIERFGAVYAVFANAGYGIEKPFHETSPDEMRRIFDVNFFGSLNIIRAALPHMRAARRGHILICSSCLARMPMTFFGAYSATKAAQHHAARSMRAELAPEAITVTSVHPVGTRTEFFEVASAGGHALSNNSPELFMQSPEFVADLIVRKLRRAGRGFGGGAELWPGAAGLFIRWIMALMTGWVWLSDRVCRAAWQAGKKRRASTQQPDRLSR